MPMNVPKRILIAPSGFKESLDAESVADAIAAGIRRVLPGARLDLVPLVDGGEGSARALAAATGGSLVPVTVTGPVGAQVDSHIALLGDGPAGCAHTVMVEMAAAAGLRLVPHDHRDPTVTTTFGVGQLIGAALDHGATRILVGCGDSGTCDGGAGALQALGARITDSCGREIGRGGTALADVADLDLSGLDPRLADVEMTVACNPYNVLTGEHGVARVFGPQKGATAAQVAELEVALVRWARVLNDVRRRAAAARPPGRSREPDIDLASAPGSGASGGLGAGLAGGLGARLLPRFDVMLDHVNLDDRIATADLVITAEGSIDYQTPRGKVPAEVARRASLQGKPVVALAGTIGAGAEAVHDIGIDAFASILPAPMPLTTAITDVAELLSSAAARAMRLIMVGCSLGEHQA